MKADPIISVVYRGLMACVLLTFISSCRHERETVPVPAVADNYPPNISRIILNRCATSGCHNAASYKYSGGSLLLDSWEHLFDGGSHGAVVIPFSPENSSLLFFTNHYPDLGPVPTEENMKMPLYSDPLSREDYLALRDWIIAGAPDKAGNIPFASNPDSRQKIYVAHQGCDYVTVIDAEKHVVMRTIPVGKQYPIESGHSIKTGSDGIAYVSYWVSQYIQKIDTRLDTVVGEINLGFANSNMLHLSPDAKTLLVTNWYLNALMRVDLGSGQISSYGRNDFVSPHGIASNRNFDTFYVTAYNGNTLYRIPATGGFTNLSIDNNPPVTSGANTPDPHNILMTPDYSRYFITCEGSNEVKVFEAASHSLVKVLPVGAKPQEMVLSKNPQTPYVFVTCLEDSNSIKGYKGSVYVINYNTLEVVKRISETYYMPHAIALDDQSGMLYVFSRNIDPTGPLPHHNSATCGGRSGYYSIFNIKTLQPLNGRRYEVTTDPYSADVRFK